VLVESRTRQLLGFTEVQFIHVQLFPHGETSGLVVRRTAKAMSVLISTRAGNVSMTINIGHDFLDMLFLHVLTADTERVRLGAVLVIREVLTHDLSHRSREISGKVVLAVRGPVVDVAATDSCVSESL